MDKLKKYSKWIKIFHIIAFAFFLLGAANNLLLDGPVGLSRECSYDSDIVDYKCWAEKHDSDIRVTERAGVKGIILWLPLFALSMFGLWQFIRLMGAFQQGTIFSHENFLRMRWIGRTYIILYLGEETYIVVTQLITKLFVPNLPEVHFRIASGSSELLPGLLFLIMAYAVQAAVEMKQELDVVV